MNTQVKLQRLFSTMVLLFGGLVLLTGFAGPIQAATINVTTTLDESDGGCSDGDCSLRDAIATAVSGDTIFVPAGNYVLTLGELEVTNDIALVGAAPAPVLDGNASSRIFQVDYNGSLTLENLIVSNGNSFDGGGIAVIGGELTLINSDVQGNTASNNGGGIYLGNGTITLVSGTVSQNTAVIGGGGIYNMEGTLVQNGGSIDGNSAGAGGGVYVNLPDAVYTLNDGLLQQNSSTAPESGGGGVYVAQGTVMVNGGQIAENSGVRGGGIESANGQIFLNDGIIRANEAQYGGGVYLSFPDAFLTQTGGEISQNVSTAADFGGGGVLGFQGSMALTGGRINQNTAVTDGGGVNIRFGDLTITGGEIVDNQAGGKGGGVFVEQADLSMAGLQLGQNSAAEGGGLYVGSSASLDLRQTAVYSNIASTNGGGLALIGSSTITNITVSGNEALTNGGGIWLQTGSFTLENVTIAGNVAAAGGGLFNSSATVTFHNNLIAGNTAASGLDCGGSVGSSINSSGYNLIQNQTGCSLTGSATGNIFGQDPKLEALTLAGENTFIHPLNAASPAIDAGDPVACPSNDQHNRPRPMDGNFDGTIICDIGAFEYGFPLRVGDVTVTEGPGGSVVANFPVTLDYVAPVTVSVSYTSGNQTAVAGQDYTAVAGTLTYTPGQTSKTVTVPILDDLLDENAETFVITLSNPVNAYLAKPQGIGTITDNDPTPKLSIQNASITEGDRNSQALLFIVTLDAPSGRSVEVNYTTADGTAVAGSDYKTTSGTLTFTPGQTSRTISVSVFGDLLPEQNETFLVILSSPKNATFSKSQAIGTITNNDAWQLYLPVVVRP